MSKYFAGARNVSTVIGGGSLDARMTKSTPIGIHFILLAFVACSRSKFEIKWFFFFCSLVHNTNANCQPRNTTASKNFANYREPNELRFIAPRVSENEFYYFRFTVPCYKITFYSTFIQVTDIRRCDCFGKKEQRTAFISRLWFSVGVVTAIACGQNCCKNRVTNALK